MIKLNYLSLIEKISQKDSIDKQTVRKVMDSFIDEIYKLKNPGDKIYLRGLGKFEIVKMKSKVMMLNNKKEKIPARNKLKFKASN